MALLSFQVLYFFDHGFSGDFGLLLLCLVFTSWTARFIRYSREHEEELNRMINQWDENLDREPSVDDHTMSFHSHLALAIMQSQIQMLEGGYGHPNGERNRPGVGDDVKGEWDRFEYKSKASLTQRGGCAHVAEQIGNDIDNDNDQPTCFMPLRLRKGR